MKTKEKITKTRKSIQNSTSINNKLSLPSKLTASQKKKIGIGIAIIAVLVIILLLTIKGLFIAAIVNGQPLTRISVIKELERQGGKTTLESLITRTLIIQEGKKRNITLNQSEIDQELMKISKNVESQGSTLDQALTAQGMTKNQLTEQIRLQLLVQKMVEKETIVSDKEVDDYLTQNKAQVPEGADQKTLRRETKDQLTQQKLQTATEKLIKELQDSAKVINLVKY